MALESFTSLPPEEEQMFVVFEERSSVIEKKANLIGWVSAGAVALVLLLIVFAFPKPSEETGFEQPEEVPAAAETGH